MSGFWLENAAASGAPTHTIVDCGYLNEQSARDNCDRLRGLVGRRNVEIVGFNRILVRIPPGKVARLSEITDIVSGGGYCWTTHRFLSVDVKAEGQ